MEGVVTVFVDKVLIFAEVETEMRNPGMMGGGLTVKHPMGLCLICVDAPWARCHVTQVALFVSYTLTQTNVDTSTEMMVLCLNKQGG